MAQTVDECWLLQDDDDDKVMENFHIFQAFHVALEGGEKNGIE